MAYQRKRMASAVSIIRDYKQSRAPYRPASEIIIEENLKRLSNDLADNSGKLWTLEPESRQHYVYVYLDPRFPGRYEYVLPSGRVVHFSFRPFYVGKGRGKRHLSHLSPKGLGKNSLKKNVIVAIRREGKTPIVCKSKHALSVSNWDALAYEVDLIAGIGRRGLGAGPLVNATDGGEGVCGRVLASTKRYTYKGTTLNAREWAERLNIDPNSFRARMRSTTLSRDQKFAHGSLEDKAVLITFKGQTLSRKEWERQLGLPKHTIRFRMRTSNKVSDWLRPLQSKTTNFTLTYKGQTLSVPEWSRKLGIKTATIWSRIRKGYSAADALSTTLSVN